jgi:hypothetical protein
MVLCGFCRKEILEPRKFKGEIVQRFCCDSCRWSYHKHVRVEKFTRELIDLLKKYGFLRFLPEETLDMTFNQITGDSNALPKT